MNCLNGAMYWWSTNISVTINQQDNNCTWCWKEGNLPPEVVMQHPTICSSCVPRQHARGVFFASTDAIFGVFVPHRASSNLIKHRTALCYSKIQHKDLLCLLSNLSLLPLSASWQNWGSHCLQSCKFTFQVITALVLLAVFSLTSTPQALQLCYWGAGSASALQAKHSWGGKRTWCVWNSSASLLRGVTMRIPCRAEFCCFSGWGWKAALVHCDCLDIVLRASTGRIASV